MTVGDNITSHINFIYVTLFFPHKMEPNVPRISQTPCKNGFTGESRAIHNFEVINQAILSYEEELRTCPRAKPPTIQLGSGLAAADEY